MVDHLLVYHPAITKLKELIDSGELGKVSMVIEFCPPWSLKNDIFRFIYWIDQDKELIVYGDGSQSRDFTYVDDITRGTILALRISGFHIINLGSDNPYKLIEIIR